MKYEDQYKQETGLDAIYRKGSSDYHTLRYVLWLENQVNDSKALLERCLPYLKDMYDPGSTFAEIENYKNKRSHLISDIEEYLK